MWAALYEADIMYLSMRVSVFLGLLAFLGLGIEGCLRHWPESFSSADISAKLYSAIVLILLSSLALYYFFKRPLVASLISVLQVLYFGLWAYPYTKTMKPDSLLAFLPIVCAVGYSVLIIGNHILHYRSGQDSDW